MEFTFDPLWDGATSTLLCLHQFRRMMSRTNVCARDRDRAGENEREFVWERVGWNGKRLPRRRIRPDMSAPNCSESFSDALWYRDGQNSQLCMSVH